MKDSTSSPKRILALDGGGVRGVIAIAFLEQIESVLRSLRPYAAAQVLADRFDLIGGTSTGAVIGTALALGLSSAAIKDFYFQLAPRVFRRSRWRITGIQARFDSRPLEREIASIVGERRLDSADLKTRLGIVLKRVDTGSAWIVTSNPASKYWHDAPDGSYIGNGSYRLASLVRASTAAPFFFAPEAIAIATGQPEGLFVDGGLTPHNNPALALFQAATIPAFGFSWPTGANELDILSIGTGRFRPRVSLLQARRMTAIEFGMKTLTSMMSDTNEQTLTMMQMLGQTDTPWAVNSELGDLSGVRWGPEPLFSYRRYDVRLDRDWLKTELGVALTEQQVERLQQMDRAENLLAIYEIGRAAAEKWVRPEHFVNG